MSIESERVAFDIAAWEVFIQVSKVTHQINGKAGHFDFKVHAVRD